MTVRFNGTREELAEVIKDLATSKFQFPHYLRRAVIDERGWVWGQHLQNIATSIQDFLEQDEYSILVLSCPPRSGKTILAQALGAWYLSRFPQADMMYVGYNLEIASDSLRAVKEIMSSRYHRRIFKVPNIAIDKSNEFMFEGKINSKPNAVASGVGGPLTGRGYDLCIADDLVKSNIEADSPTTQKRMRDWLSSTLLTRQSPKAKTIFIGTIWNTEDILEYVKATYADITKVINYPAIITDEDGTEHSMFPERYSLEDMYARKRMVGTIVWDAMYMCSPKPIGGGLIKSEWLRTAPIMTADDIVRVRAWDLSGGVTDYSAGCLMAYSPSKGEFQVLDMIHVKASPNDMMEIIRNTAKADGVETSIFLEREGGSAGMITADHIARHILVGYDFHTEHPTGSKTIRAQPMCASIENGTLTFVQAPWLRDLWDELLIFPNGGATAHDDQVDAMSHAFNWLSENGVSDAGNIFIL